MKPEQILDSMYIIPVLLDHFDNPTDLTTQILGDNGIFDEQIEQMRQVRHMLEYHRWSVVSGYAPNYPLLRIGLKQYYATFLKTMFTDIGFYNKRIMALDYGCGTGQVADQFLFDNPESEIILMDKENQTNKKIIQVDFEREPTWYQPYAHYFNLVILSEVLHCKTPIFQEYLIKSSTNMLKRGGHILIVENVDFCMAYRISKIKQGSYKVLNADDIKKLTANYPLKLVKVKNIQRHKIYLYEKI